MKEFLFKRSKLLFYCTAHGASIRSFPFESVSAYLADLDRAEFYILSRINRIECFFKKLFVQFFSSVRPFKTSLCEFFLLEFCYFYVYRIHFFNFKGFAVDCKLKVFQGISRPESSHAVRDKASVEMFQCPVVVACMYVFGM
ncbi:hypothetical protein DU68_08170 [Methanosarcina mazei]|uniref:Uncharacterized protein n=1 Tax=Methanosarcina mazei TaxID=2209 RepID=A0A0F8GPW8_METMZ|nr:hypothetical protein DU33_08545 [Methanosarcina mazei]KKG64675.1 hypothetical protein DU45_07550 [Methanosarcina mazei]KKG66451.1 hypothetical protein DU64_08385 [Methanosarcina mazei]KKG97629.1 hypothetical protein DU66_08645 [Methanosarcina mazei]KKG98406.1 hypothetical protein DU68_08170 [Methanosarcina mazei]